MAAVSGMTTTQSPLPTPSLPATRPAAATRTLIPVLEILDVNFSLLGTVVTPDPGGSGNLFNDNPLLGALADNGGLTQTHTVLASSPAIDAGDPLFDPNAFTPPLVNDQRGAPFVREAGLGIDIGAHERQTVAGLNLTVDTTIDENDGDYSAGDLSLREAIGLANGNAGTDTITFSSLFDTAQTIALGSQLPTIVDSVTINGPGANRLTISAGDGVDGTFGTDDGFRIFNIDDGDDGNLMDVEISSLLLTGADVPSSDQLGNGGAILNRENLTVTSSTISDNSASFSGGGIYNEASGILTVANTSISNNSSDFGGGIFSVGLMDITSSTISNNSAH